jgi:hypothetical protein
MEKARRQGLSWWQAGEYARATSAAEGFLLDGDEETARECRYLAVQAGNLQEGETLILPL